MKTLIQSEWVVGFDGHGHVLHRDGSVVIEDDRIAWVGGRYPGTADRTIGGRGRVVIPGLINMHNHAAVHSSELVIAERGRHDVFNSGVLSFLPTLNVAPAPGVEVTEEEYLAGARFAFCEMLKSGATTICEAGCLGATIDQVGSYAERFVDIVDEVGFRAYVAPGFSAENTYRDAQDRIVFIEKPGRGMDELEHAVRFIEDHAGSSDGRLQGMLFPNIDVLCTPELLAACAAEAERLDVRMQTHCAQALLDHHEGLRRHRASLVEYLADAGWLGPRAILGHALFTSAHPWSRYPGGRDLELIAASETTVVHCPTVFARRGVALHSFQRYEDAGINMCIGTDTYPMDVISELRHAAYVCRVVDSRFDAASSRSLFDAVTVNAARALGRDDIGRLAPGAKADLVILDLDKVEVGPYIDPIRAIVNCASGRDVETVIVDGRTVVEEGRLTRVDEKALLEQARAVTARDLEKIRAQYWPGRTLDEVAPPSYPIV